MKAKRFLTAAALLIAALFILDVPAAAANEYRWTGEDVGDPTEWTDSDNWSCQADPTGYPNGTDDKAVMADVTGTGSNCVLDSNITVGAVTIEAVGHLYVTAGSRVTLTIQKEAKPGDGTGILIIETNGTPGQLTIGANGTVHLDSLVTHGIAGQIHLTTATSILHVDETATLDGYDDDGGMDYGTLDGQHNSAQITIAASKTLTNEITIEGALTIAGGSKATFDNDGTVWANDGTTADTRDCLTLDSGTFTGSGTYEVNRTIGENAAYLEFDESGVTATGLGTCFIVSNGTLDIYTTTVTTTGGLSFTGGNIVLASGCTFTASGTCP